MSAIFLGIYPSGLQSIGLMCAILGATVMSVDIPLLESKSDDKFTNIKESNLSPDRERDDDLNQYHSNSTEHSHESGH